MPLRLDYFLTDVPNLIESNSFDEPKRVAVVILRVPSSRIFLNLSPNLIHQNSRLGSKKKMFENSYTKTNILLNREMLMYNLKF